MRPPLICRTEAGIWRIFRRVSWTGLIAFRGIGSSMRIRRCIISIGKGWKKTENRGGLSLRLSEPVFFSKSGFFCHFSWKRPFPECYFEPITSLSRTRPGAPLCWPSKHLFVFQISVWNFSFFFMFLLFLWLKFPTFTLWTRRCKTRRCESRMSKTRGTGSNSNSSFRWKNEQHKTKWIRFNRMGWYERRVDRFMRDESCRSGAW